MVPVRRRDLETALRANGYTIISDRGPHTKWGCPCGAHGANIPRYRMIAPRRRTRHDPPPRLPA